VGTTAPAAAGVAVANVASDAAATSLRAPPAALLDWSPNVRVAHSLEDFAQWLTQGATLPNMVLFAPLVPSALGLNF